MSQAKRAKDKPRKANPFVLYEWEVLNSGAYAKLTGSAAKALPIFIGKGNKAQGKRFEFSYGEARRLGLSDSTFTRVLNELVAVGFIDQVGYGGLKGFCKTNSLFVLSSRWQEYGTKAFQVKARNQSEPS